jgi:SAM-dependent methyltransferase
MPALLLDAGAGTGGFLAHALAAGLPPGHAIGVEGDGRAVTIARARGVPIVECDVTRIEPGDLPGTPDVVTSLDVLEHLDDPVAVLARLRGIVQPGGYAVVLVPAIQRLWSAWDDRLGHRRRYDRRLLSEHLVAGGWTPIELRYLFGPLAVPGLLRERLAGRSALLGTRFPRVPSALNRLLMATFIAETYLPSPPFGTTLAAAARAG